MRYVSNVHNFSITPFVKALIIANAFIWFFFVVVLQGLFLDKAYVFYLLGLTPERVFSHFWLWQPVTYFFVHAPGFFHIFFNMFALWMFGSELERLWGYRFFLAYYMCCGIGAGLIYLLCPWIGILFFNASPAALATPMIGASGAIFGILFAYGLIFSERIIYFMMVFPIRARHFTLLIGLMEFVSLINSGVGSSISHLAHLSGFVSGFLFLQIWKTVQNFNVRKWRKKPSHLKVLNDEDGENKKLH